MRITGTQCDDCKNNHIRDELQQSSFPAYIPPNWFTVRRGTMSEEKNLHFCSKECLKRWAERPPGKDYTYKIPSLEEERE